MPIIVNLYVMMAKRKISLNELASRIGITQANLSVLKTGKAKAVLFTTLEAICKDLNCQPGNLLEWEDKLSYRKIKTAPPISQQGSMKSDITSSSQKLKDKVVIDINL